MEQLVPLVITLIVAVGRGVALPLLQAIAEAIEMEPTRRSARLGASV